jgi:hypothetical protein
VIVDWDFTIGIGLLVIGVISSLWLIIREERRHRLQRRDS